MHAIIETGGKQYAVEKGVVLDVDRLAAEKGATVTFDRVLFASDGGKFSIGRPHLAGASVQGEVVEQFRADKVVAYKKRRRHGYERNRGHRQQLTRVRVTEIRVA
ncbi:MAG: 50S ribosomal protein L21 [Verrucomicrobiae bacterium]|nr:50S ribosomal protein L21 [Verrucomicrobiae bacterium]